MQPRYLLALLIALVFSGQAHADPGEQASPEMRELVHVAQCLASRQGLVSRKLLTKHYGTDQYPAKMAELAAESGCYLSRIGVSLRADERAFAGALATALLQREDGSLINRLSMAVLLPAPATISQTDEIASCVVRGAPHLVADLLETDINSDGEARKAEILDPIMRACGFAAENIEISTFGMRSVLAVAAFRQISMKKEDDA